MSDGAQQLTLYDATSHLPDGILYRYALPTSIIINVDCVN